MREWSLLKSIPNHLPWVLGLTVVMGVAGPFGTYQTMGLGLRLIYFTLTGVLAWVQVIGGMVVLQQIELFNRWPVAARMALVGILAALPGTAEIIIIYSWLAHPIPWRAFPHIFSENAFLTVTIAVLIGLFFEQRLHAVADTERARIAAVPAVGAPATAVPDFFRRVPPALGRDLLALEMEDHYLRIHTALGSDLILLRLRDALAELGPSCGRQVHRSWWVAEGAIACVQRNGGRNVLVLRNGLHVPVSKTFRDQVKQAGWLD